MVQWSWPADEPRMWAMELECLLVNLSFKLIRFIVKNTIDKVITHIITF